MRMKSMKMRYRRSLTRCCCSCRHFYPDSGYIDVCKKLILLRLYLIDNDNHFRSPISHLHAQVFGPNYILYEVCHSACPVSDITASFGSFCCPFKVIPPLDSMLTFQYVCTRDFRRNIFAHGDHITF